MTTTPSKARTFVKNLLLRVLRIEEAIKREQRKRLPDPFRLLHMKKLRLTMKDRLRRALPNGNSGHMQT